MKIPPEYTRRCKWIITTIFCLCLLTSIAKAQGIIVLKPSSYIPLANDSVTIRVDLFNGKGNAQMPILQLKRYAPDGFDYNIQHDLKSIDSLPLVLHQIAVTEGTQVVILHSKYSQVEIAADSLTKLMTLYNKTNKIGANKMAEPASNKISVQQNAKLILQVGNRYSDNCMAATTLPLDVVPEKHLYRASKKPLKISFRILFKGAPAMPAVLTIWHRQNSTADFAATNLKPRKNGKVKTVINPSGEYIITAAIIAAPVNTGGITQLYLTSASWGY